MSERTEGSAATNPDDDLPVDAGEGPISVPTLREADEAASVAHDFIFGLNGVTKEEASVAIWTIHNALRPLLDDQTICMSCGGPMDLRESIACPNCGGDPQ